MENTMAPVAVDSSCENTLRVHPSYRFKSDYELLVAVRAVPGMVSRKTGMLVLPVCNEKGEVNRAMAVAVLLGTRQVL